MTRRNRTSDFRRQAALSLLGLARVLDIGSEEVFGARDFVSGREPIYSYEAMKEDMGTLRRYAQALAHDFESGVREGLGVPEVSRDYNILIETIIALAHKVKIDEEDIYANSILRAMNEKPENHPYYLDKVQWDIETISLGISALMHDRESLKRELDEERGEELRDLKSEVDRLRKENEALLDSRKSDGWLLEQIGFEEVIPLKK